MAGEIDLVARMTAYELGRAVPLATRCHVAICDHALVLAPVAMAGEDTTIHALALGHLGEEPKILAVADPRFRDHQYELFRKLGLWIEQYFAEQREAGGYPQLIVSSGAAAKLLDLLSDRLRFNKTDEKVARLGQLLAYSTERYPLAGQQALITATGALRQHLATGQQEGEDEHLGALLTWIAPPAGLPILEAVERAERQPMGANTDPEFDDKVLEPLVRAFNKARHDGAPPALRRAKALAVRDALAPVVVAIYRATQQAIEILRELGLPPLPDLETLEAREVANFDNFMRSRDQGYRVPLHDSAKAATHKLVARESAVEGWGAALVHGDRVERARSLVDGAVIAGVIEAVTSVSVGPRRKEHYVTLRSKQAVLRARARDQLCSIGDQTFAFVVEGVSRDDQESLIELKLTKGVRRVGELVRGVALELGSAPPDWGWSLRQQKKIKERLADPPWTHGGEQPEAEARREIPDDLVAAVERLR